MLIFCYFINFLQTGRQKPHKRKIVKMIPNFCRNQTNSSELDLLLNQMSHFSYNFTGSILSIFGAIFNTFSLLILLSSSLKHSFYDFLQCRCICNLIVSVIGIFYHIFGGWKLCGTDYATVFVQFYLLLLPIRIAFFASVISDNLLILNRLANLYEMKRSTFLKLSKTVITLLASFKM